MANRLIAPEDITSLSWTPVLGDPVANTIAAPDGTMTGDTMVDDASTGTGTVRIQQGPSGAALVDGSPYHVSCFLKPLGLDWVLISLAGYTPLSIYAYFNTTTKEFGTVGADNDGVGIEYDADGWVRPYISFTPSADVAGVLRVYPAAADNDLTVPVDGSSSFYMWGATVDDGAIPAPYVSEAGITVGASSDRIISGVTSSVTRNITRGVTESWSN